MIRLALLLSLLLAPAPAHAVAPDLSEYRWVQRPGAQLPPDDLLRDEDGRPVRVAELPRSRPLILALGYYQCPNLCGLVRSTLLSALDAAGLVGGRDYVLAVVSIDPHETSKEARTAKAADIASYPLSGAQTHWRYLTGDQQSITTLTDAVGFEGRFDPALKELVHPTGLVLVTPSGRISSYLLGLSYRPGDLRVAVAEANHGTIRAAVAPILLLCFHYDATTGQYTLSILKLLKLVAALTLVTVAGIGVLVFRRDART